MVQLSNLSSFDIVLMGANFNSKIGAQDALITEHEKNLTYLPHDYEKEIFISI